MRPSTVARFNSVSVIASGSVKLAFNSVTTACRSAGLNELTRSSVVGLDDGEGDESADGLAEAAGLLGDITVYGGVCASAVIAVKQADDVLSIHVNLNQPPESGSSEL